MTSKQLFETMQYLDDTLVDVPDTSKTRPKRYLYWGAAAACLIAAIGVAFTLPRVREAWDTTAFVLDGDTEISGESTVIPDVRNAHVRESSLTQPPQSAGTGNAPERGGVPGPGTEEAPKPAVLAWNERDSAPVEVDMSVIMVGEPLTAAQSAACAPEIRLEWMEDFDGFATYYLKDGAGGLAYIELTVHDSLGVSYTIQIRDRDAIRMPSCGIEQLDTDKVGSIDGQEYRAYRTAYYHGEGDPNLYPPELWTDMAVIFEKENMEYTLSVNVPQTMEECSALELLDLLRCYAGTHHAPDLSQFHYGEYLLRDEYLTLAEALEDPDFGMYFPAEGPDGFELSDIRRYQFEEKENYLMGFWARGNAYLQWIVQPMTDDAQRRIVSTEDRESYDLSLYPILWSAYTAQENWDTVENPVFRIGELTTEVINARVHTGDEGMPMCNFSVFFDEDILIQIRTKGVSQDWLFQALTQIESTNAAG